MRNSIINQAFWDANSDEILNLARAAGVGNPKAIQLQNCVLIRGADLTQMNVVPDSVQSQARNPDESDEAFKSRTTIPIIADLNKVLSASPHVVMVIESAEDMLVIQNMTDYPRNPNV